MSTGTRQLDWTAVGSLAVLSALIYYSGSFYLLFPAPLQFLYGKTDRRHFAVGGAIALVLIGLIVLHRLGDVPEELHRVALLEGLTPVGMIAGLSILNSRLPGGRTAQLFMAGVVIAALALPSVLTFVGSDLFGTIVGRQVESIEQAILGVGVDTTVAELFGVDPIEFFRGVWLRLFATGLTVMLGLNWMLGRRLSGGRSAVSIDRYRTPDWLPTVFAASLAAAVLDAMVGISVIGIAGWNTMGVAAAIFAVQGLSVLQFMVGNGGKRPTMRALVPLVLLVMLLVPFLSGVVLVGLPMLGIAEHWMRKRSAKT